MWLKAEGRSSRGPDSVGKGQRASRAEDVRWLKIAQAIEKHRPECRCYTGKPLKGMSRSAQNVTFVGGKCWALSPSIMWRIKLGRRHNL